jgi:hypothetical protein
VRDEVSDIEDDSYEQDFEGEKLPFVELKNKSVQKGFERLGRLLQIKRKPLDYIEVEILEKKFKPD